MTEDVGERLARVANERKLVADSRAEDRRTFEDLSRAKAEANLEYLRGLLARMVSGFNRTADAALHVSLRAEYRQIFLVQSFTLLMTLSFEGDAVSLESPPLAPRLIRKRFRFETGEGGTTHLVEDAELGVTHAGKGGSAESFCEGVLMLALDLYAFD